MAFVQAEDMTGLCEVIVFPKVLTAYDSLIHEGNIVVVEGRINTKDDEIKILADKIYSPDLSILEKNKENTPETRENDNTVLTSVNKNENFDTVSKIFLRFPEKGSKIEQRIVTLAKMFPGKTPVYFYYRDTEKLFAASGLDLDLSKELLLELRSILGEDNVKLK